MCERERERNRERGLGEGRKTQLEHLYEKTKYERKTQLTLSGLCGFLNKRSIKSQMYSRC